MATQPQGQVIPPNEAEGEIPLTAGMMTAIEEGDRRSMIAAAKANPRSIVAFRKELDELVTLSEGVAQEMTYSLPRGDKQIIGPSVRFAEVVCYCYRNLRAASEVIDVGDKQVTARGIVYDAERNNGRADNVSRNITTSSGKRYNQDMIGTTGNAASQIAFRNAVLHYVPKALWLESWEKSKAAAVGSVETIGKKRTDALTHFNQMGVTDVMVFNTLGVRGTEDIKTDELVALKSWAREIKAGTRSIEDIFGSPLDEEIERTMKALGWNETQKRLSRTSFAGNREGHLAYVKAEAAKSGIVVESIGGAKAKPEQAKVTEMPKQEVAQTQPDPTPSPQPTESATQPNSSMPSTPTPSTSSPTTQPTTKRVTPDW